MAEPSKPFEVSGLPKARRWPWIVGGLAAVLVVNTWLAPHQPQKAQQLGIPEADAFRLCERAIRSKVRDPEKAVIPPVTAIGDQDELLFSWNQQTRVLRLRNGLGLDVASTGSCTVQRIGRNVSSVTISGERVL